MRKQRGTALIEFALVVPLILVLTFTVIEMGRAVQRYNGAAKAVRDAVRYLSVQQQGTHQVEAANLIVYGNIAGTGPLLDPALTINNVVAPSWATVGSNPIINTVTIKVSGYTFTPMVSSVFGASFPQIIFGDISATMRCPL